jgi:hypothetical protein
MLTKSTATNTTEVKRSNNLFGPFVYVMRAFLAVTVAPSYHRNRSRRDREFVTRRVWFYTPRKQRGVESIRVDAMLRAANRNRSRASANKTPVTT